MNTLQNAILWIYRLLLKAYPAPFYTQFADEMVETCQMRLEESPQLALRIGLREIGSLMVSIVRERQRTPLELNHISAWQMWTILALPAVFGCIVLLFRPVHKFFIPGYTWLVFAGISLVIVLFGWLTGRRLIVLALPVLGYMLALLMRVTINSGLAGGNGLTLETRNAVPYAALIAVLLVYSRSGLRLKRWALYVAALPICALLTGLLVILASGGLDRGLSAGELIDGYVRGTFIQTGTMSLLILAGLPLAYYFGSKAVLLLVGCLFSEYIGLSASLMTDDLQRIVGGIFVVVFLLVIPVLNLRSSRRAHEHLSVLLPLTLACCVVLVLVNILMEQTEPIFSLYRIGDLMQTLIALSLAIEVYGQFNHQAKPDEAPVHADDLSTALS